MSRPGTQHSQATRERYSRRPVGHMGGMKTTWLNVCFEDAAPVKDALTGKLRNREPSGGGIVRTRPCDDTVRESSCVFVDPW